MNRFSRISRIYKRPVMQESTSTRRCFFHLNVAILLWGITPLLVKIISIPVIPLIAFRCLIAASALLLVNLTQHVGFRLKTGKDVLLVLCCGIMMAAHWVAYFYSIRISSVAIAVISMCSYPVITILLEPFMHHEHLRKSDLLTGFVVFLGVAMLVRDFNLSDHITQGVLLGLCAAFLFALRGIISRGLVRQYDSTMIMMYQISIAGVILLPSLFLIPFTFQHNDFLWTLVLGLVFTACSHTLYISSLVGLKAKTAGIMQSLTPLYSALFASLFIGEQPTLRILIGGAIVLIAAIHESLHGYKQR